VASVRITARPPTGTAGGSTFTEWAAERPGIPRSQRAAVSAPNPSRSAIPVLAGLNPRTKPAPSKPDAELLAEPRLAPFAPRRGASDLPDHRITALEHAERREARQRPCEPRHPFARERGAVAHQSRKARNRLLDPRAVAGDATRGRRKQEPL